MSNALSWFEIPVTDLARAKRFYGSVLQAELREESMSGRKMAIFPYEKDGVGGALLEDPALVPGAQGVVVYLNAGDDLDGAISRIEPAGGKVLLGKTLISEDVGSIAQFLDTEGNRVALHSPR
jgi:predicted enzyme related to lactoylglutathione lyase